MLSEDPRSTVPAPRLDRSRSQEPLGETDRPPDLSARRFLRWALPIGIGALLLSLLYVAARYQAVNFHGTLMDQPAPDLVLHDQFGKPFRLSQERGHVLLLFFGYTHCPEACPLTLATWKRVEQILGPAASGVRFVYVTVDPERDTEAVLREHLALFDPKFIGLTGTPEELQQAYRSFGVYSEKTILPGTTNYVLGHTSTTFVIDKSGRWRLDFPYRTGVNEIAADLSRLLDE